VMHSSPTSKRNIIATAEAVELLSTTTTPTTYNGVEHTKIHSDIRLSIRTGQYRVVRRMLAAVGLPVIRLYREAIGPVVLGELGGELASLAESHHMRLSDGGVAALWKSVGGRSIVEEWKQEDMEARLSR